MRRSSTRGGSVPRWRARTPTADGARRPSAVVEEARNSEVVKNSGQASAGLEQLTGEIVYLEGRWDDAYEIGRRGWAINEVQDLSLDLSSLAAAAAADLGRTEAVNEAISTNLVNEFPSTIALRQMGATFKALLEGRWDDARQLFVATSRTFDGMQRYRAKALFGLTVGHLAGDRFPEAAEGLREAEAFFEDRGAGAVVATYRAKAVIPLDRGRTASPRSDAASGVTAVASVPGEASSPRTSGRSDWRRDRSKEDREHRLIPRHRMPSSGGPSGSTRRTR